MIKKEPKPNAGSSVSAIIATPEKNYGQLIANISGLLEQARRTTARAVNNILAAAYWEIGRRIVEFEQKGKQRAEYGEQLLTRIAHDLVARYGRGFSARNLRQMRAFFLGWEIWQTPSAKFEARAKGTALPGGLSQKKVQIPSGKSEIVQIMSAKLPPIVFPLSWSHYVGLLAVKNPEARAFYESEAIRGGWSVRQLDRQISTLFFERMIRSKNRKAVLANGRKAKPEDEVTLQEEIRDPYLLEFLNLKDEYSEADLEDAIIRHLEWFLLELGAGFTFVARQKRIRIGDEWFRIDLLLYHRKLKCLIVIDLKIGKFTHADAGQMNLYLNYVRENLTEPGENKPVGLILCSAKNDAVVHYAMGGIKANVFASQYLTILPDEETLRNEIMTTQQVIRARKKKE